MCLRGEGLQLDFRTDPEKSNENDQPEYLRQNSSNSPNTKKEEEGVIYSSSMNNRNKQEESKGYIVKSRLR